MKKTNLSLNEEPMTIFGSLDELNEGICMFKFIAVAVQAINQTTYKELSDEEQFGMQSAFDALAAKLEKTRDFLDSQLRKSHA